MVLLILHGLFTVVGIFSKISLMFFSIGDWNANCNSQKLSEPFVLWNTWAVDILDWNFRLHFFGNFSSYRNISFFLQTRLSVWCLKYSTKKLVSPGIWFMCFQYLFDWILTVYHLKIAEILYVSYLVPLFYFRVGTTKSDKSSLLTHSYVELNTIQKNFLSVLHSIVGELNNFFLTDRHCIQKQNEQAHLTTFQDWLNRMP